MRPIKFRAWNKLAHKMALIDMLDFMLDAYRAHAGKSSGSGHLADIELMQFTGLYDKNGKEVYEGDIIRCYTGRGNDEYWYSKTVVWTTDRCNCGFLLGSGGKIEIIGNTYEQPDLVRQEEQEA